MSLFIRPQQILTRFQIDRYLGGGGVPFLGASGAKEIMIPVVLAEKQEEIVTHIQSIRTQAHTLQQHAEQILAEAKAQIERMILGGEWNRVCPQNTHFKFWEVNDNFAANLFPCLLGKRLAAKLKSNNKQITKARQ